MAKPESKIVKVRPEAKMRMNDWDYPTRWDVDYSCPGCGKRIREGDIACDQCGTFFDWTMRARVRLEPVLDWVVR